ncbi:transcriptional regulator, XRE family with cupin sensor [Micromonospora pattaloongensis]|uniref:Transcriptional regulator, XRE family with cupin sensor n=1 Tax=Micromonospora pattaloongensis TaxID=405436 RepID=A0A1H3SHF8_9ACTN|nr:XRE family transcriptional regulator [Micromonospora pattaloongensis]SDZ37120.1 transcriptional regulator, XRE family with cupin sensor [Micromonospora pattaloongensis]
MNDTDVQTRAVGRRLRRLREAQGVSLSELARRAGIGKATLSGVEAGTRNPTLETLYAVTAQLGVPLATVLTDGETPGATPAEVRGSAVVGTLLQVFEEATTTYELYRLRIVPGTAQVSPAHHAGVTEHLTVFRGVLRAGPLDAPLVAGPGEHISWRSDVPHGYAVLGDEEVHASLLVRSPATADPA